MRNIAIVGSGTGREQAPHDDTSWEIWSLNNLFNFIQDKRITRWFELHDIGCNDSGITRRGITHYVNQSVEDYLKQIDSLNVPVYMQHKHPLIKKSRPYPFKSIMKEFGKYFGCSFAWMIALALHEHAKGKPVSKIGLWGCSLTGVEYYYQRPSTEYMIGLARGNGIEVYIHDDCNLLKEPYIYAIDERHNVIQDLYVGNAKIFLQWLTIQWQLLLMRAEYGEGLGLNADDLL